MTVLTQNQIDELDRIYPEWRTARPLLRMQLVSKVTRNYPASNADKVKAVLAQSELDKIEKRLASHLQSTPPKFANGRAHYDKVTAYLDDKAKGIRRRLEQPSS